MSCSLLFPRTKVGVPPRIVVPFSDRERKRQRERDRGQTDQPDYLNYPSVLFLFSCMLPHKMQIFTRPVISPGHALLSINFAAESLFVVWFQDTTRFLYPSSSST